MQTCKSILTDFFDKAGKDDMFTTAQLLILVSERQGTNKKETAARVNMTMSRLVKDGLVSRVQRGVYCRCVHTPFGILKPDATACKIKAALRDPHGDVIGYVTGPSALHSAGLASLMPRKTYIATNRRLARNGGDLGILKPGCKGKARHLVITTGNYRYLQLLDMLRDMDSVVVDAANPKALLCQRMKHFSLKTEVLLKYARQHYNHTVNERVLDLITGVEA